MAVAYFEAAILVLQTVLRTQANRLEQLRSMCQEIDVVGFTGHFSLSYEFVVIMPSNAYMQVPLK